MIEVMSTSRKLHEIIAEMKAQGLWKKEMPPWVTDYDKAAIRSQSDFAGWLQFVFLPNHLLNANGNDRLPGGNFIVLQAKRFFGPQVQKGRLLQLLIELDAMI
ncbi:MAG: YqcC family protein [Luteolibacter sp.]